MASFNLIEQIAKNQSNELRQLQVQNATADNMNGTSDSAAEMVVYQPGEGLDTAAADGMLRVAPTPEEDCCIFSADKHFGGRQVQICHDGSHPLTVNLGAYNFAGEAESVTCGKNVRLNMCDAASLDGCSTRASQYGRIENPDLGWRISNRVVTVSLKPYTPRTYGAVTLFDQRGCSGQSSSFPYLREEGRTVYQNGDLDWRGIGTNQAASIMVPRGYVADLYTGANLSGQQQHIVGWQNEYGRMACVDLNEQQNDETESMVVKPIRQGQAVGYWENIHSLNGETKFTVEEGVTDEYGNTAEVWQKDMLGASMELGIEFWGNSFTTSLSADFEQGFRNTVTNTCSISTKRTVEYTCGQDDGQGHGLWQWMVRTHDNSIVAHTPHYACRSGNNIFNVAPSCPWNACANGDCTACKSGWN